MEVGRVHPFRPSSSSLHPDLDLGRGERREGGVWQNISRLPSSPFLCLQPNTVHIV